MKIFGAVMLCALACNAMADEYTPSSGLEVDALPYLTGGYYLGAWTSFDAIRVRTVVAETNVPEFVVSSGFSDQHVRAFALVVDYFPGGGVNGLWYGAGVEQWRSRIREDVSGTKADYSNDVLTAGLGYLVALSPRWYLNPWGAVHAIVGGDRTVNVGGKDYKPQTITGEVSLKLGLRF